VVSSPKNIQIDVLGDEQNEPIENDDFNSPESENKELKVDTFELSKHKQDLNFELPTVEGFLAKSDRAFTRRP